MLRLQPQSLTRYQQGGCLATLYCHSPEVGFLPLCLHAIRRTLLCFSFRLRLVGLKLLSFKDSNRHQPLYHYCCLLGNRSNYLIFLARLHRLSLRVSKHTSCYLVQLKSLGPCILVSGHLILPPTLEVLNPNMYLTSLGALFSINICLIFSCHPVEKSLSAGGIWNYEGLDLGSYKCSFYAFRFFDLNKEISNEIALLEFISSGIYASASLVLNSLLRVFYGCQKLSKVVLKS